MSNLVDVTNWPLVHVGMTGRLTVQDATELNDAMLATLTRARSEGRRFALVTDRRERSAPEKGAIDVLHGFWAEQETEIATWCVGLASILATPSLADLVENPGPGGLEVLGTIDPDAALLWAKDRLAMIEA